MSLFDDLEPLKTSPVPGRLVTKAKIEEGPFLGEPVAVITPKEGGLELSFVRASTRYPFKETMRQFSCYASKKGYPIVRLQDDALFSDGDCMYRALFYRVFEGKASLYVDQGFLPSVSIDDHRRILYTAPISTVKELGPLLPAGLNATLATARDDARFGEWLLHQDCNTLREFLNKIEGLAFKSELNARLSENARQFLVSWKAYKQAHDKLSKVPDCKPPRGGSLRSRTRASSRRQHKRRVTRSNRRHRKGTQRRGHTR